MVIAGIDDVPRTLELHRKLDAVGDLLDGLRDAVLVLDQGRRPVVTNAPARALLADGSGLELDPSGRLHSPKCEPPLPVLLASPTGVGVVDRSPERPLLLSARRLDTGGNQLWIVAPEDQPPPDARWLGLAYGLTQAEIRVVARLASGLRPDAIADSLGVCVGTVRNQLKQAFAKTRVNSQSALVALVLANTPRLRLSKKSADGRC